MNNERDSVRVHHSQIIMRKPFVLLCDFFADLFTTAFLSLKV